ncbi:hypothetical protein [Embleya sp. AB8]|uniref:hypothetical protein n=1 Tax=Embleya sp. AB8 TaxID=3156304 RepID=UPI003C7766B0
MRAGRDGHGLDEQLFPYDLSGYCDGSSIPLGTAPALLRAMVLREGTRRRLVGDGGFFVHVGTCYDVKVGVVATCEQAAARAWDWGRPSTSSTSSRTIPRPTGSPNNGPPTPTSGRVEPTTRGADNHADFCTAGSPGGGDGVHYDQDRVNHHRMRIGPAGEVGRAVEHDQAFRWDAATYFRGTGACLFHEVPAGVRCADPGEGRRCMVRRGPARDPPQGAVLAVRRSAPTRKVAPRARRRSLATLLVQVVSLYRAGRAITGRA